MPYVIQRKASGPGAHALKECHANDKHMLFHAFSFVAAKGACRTQLKYSLSTSSSATDNTLLAGKFNGRVALSKLEAITLYEREREREREREKLHSSIQPAWLMRTDLCSCA